MRSSLPSLAVVASVVTLVTTGVLGACSSGPTPEGTVSGSSSGGAGSSSGAAEGDAGADPQAWLVPMNAARSAVGEGPLHWDPIAATVATGWASQCDYVHNPNASSQYAAAGGSGGLGENLAAGAPTLSVSASVAAWVAEEADYDHATNTCASGKECGHYTQIVWAKTTGVGCAQVSCMTGTPFSGSGSAWQISVCNFSPPGNYVGQPPY